MKVFEDVIDIGDEVIKYAHSQGHTKARQNTIRWDGLKTMSKNLMFTETGSKQQSTTYYGSEKVYKALAKHLTAAEMNFSNNEPLTAVAALDDKIRVSEAINSENQSNIYIQENFLLNTENEKKLCKISFQGSCKNTAEAHVKFTKTIFCSQKPVKPSKINTRIKQNRNVTGILNGKTTKASKNPLSKISLAPKFKTSLNLDIGGCKKISLPKPGRYEVVAKIPNGIKIPIEITQHIEEENGKFEVDYYLWGSVQVTVWGKPYKLMITDILDQKYNAEFNRETIFPPSLQQSRSHSSKESGVQAVKITLQGRYECKKIRNEFMLKIPKCILRRTSYSLESLKCTCDTAELPKDIEAQNILPLTNKNLAKIVLRWRLILYSFRTQHKNNDDQWLWKAVLNKNTKLAAIASNLKVDKMCRTSTAIDRFLMTLLLWREGCRSIEDLGQSTNYEDKLQELTLALIKQLYEVGIPVPVISFLWEEEKHVRNTEALYNCPLHRFQSEPMINLDCLSKSIRMKLMAPLPDRVLLRLLQHWPQQDGWIVAGLHLGVDLLNIKNLACNDRTFKSIHEKRLTVFKLWRMNHRRDSTKSCKYEESNDQKVNSENCMTWNLCEELHEMDMPKETYNFLWLDSETTP